MSYAEQGFVEGAVERAVAEDHRSAQAIAKDLLDELGVTPEDIASLQIGEPGASIESALTEAVLRGMDAARDELITAFNNGIED